MPAAGVDAAVRAIRSWPGYAPTPLRDMPRAARAAAVATVTAKDEGGRFGAGSFKVSGAAWAVDRLVAERSGAGGTLTLCCATDGNHGRAVAWAARRAGCRAVVYLAEHALPQRVARIRALGAETRAVPGTYDAAVERASVDAARNGWVVVADTGGDDADPIVRHVFEGYALMVEEALAQAYAPPTHVFLQVGVGSMAGAVAAQLVRRLGARAPTIVLVEPEAASCLLPSLAADAIRVDDGELATVMDCLAAGVPAASAWPILRGCADAAVTVDDDAARAAVERAAADGVATAPSGAAGLAGFLAAAGDARLRERLGLDASSRVLLFATEEPL